MTRDEIARINGFAVIRRQIQNLETQLTSDS